MICPYCTSGITELAKNSKTNDQYKCKSCGKTFYAPNESLVTEEPCMDIEPGKVLKVSYDKTVKIHCATDVHHGAKEHHYNKFNSLIEEVDSDPDARWFLNGDNIEFIPPNYKISQRGQVMEPDEQHLTFMKRIEKIADKLLFIRGGNHDMTRSVNILGVDVCKLMADRLMVPYFRMPGYSEVQIGDRRWYMVSGHGKSGAKNGDLELDKMAAVYSDGDVFILGHNHQLYAKPIDSVMVDGDEERLHRRWYCRGGSFLKYADYARYSFFPIVRSGWVTIEFGEKEIKTWTN